MNTGAMLALVPTSEDAARLAIRGGEDASELHVTIGYYGQATELTEDQRNRIVRMAQILAADRTRAIGNAFSVNAFSPGSDDACLVYGIGGGDIDLIHQHVESALADVYTQPRPYVAHLTAAYTDDLAGLSLMADNLGPVTFDRVRVAFGDEVMDFPVGRQSTAVTAAVNTKYWRSWPVAERETKFDADSAITRLLQWSGGSAAKFNQAFLWRNEKGQPSNRESYRLPIADVMGGKLTLIPRAVFSAAVILSGGHGGLEGVVDENEREQLKNVLNQIYADLQEKYQDPRVRPPWLLGRTKEEREEGEEEMARTASLTDAGDDPFGAGVWTVEGLVASVNSSWSGIGFADDDRPWDGNAARARVWEWADGDFRRYRKAFLWFDSARPDQKNSYKLPIADVIDGDLKIVPRALSAVAGVLAGARGGVDIPDEDMDDVERVVTRLQSRAGGDERESTTAAAAPVAPPSSWFDEPQMTRPEPFTVFPDGRVAGLIASFNRCHAGIMEECVMAPRSASGYKYFLNGQVLTSDGRMIKVGKITMGTGHATPNMRWIPAADHYDNTGTAAAIVRVGENRFGIWAAGASVSSLNEEQVAELRRSPISGDWRRIDGHMELVAALAVNVPGFPIVASMNYEPQAILAAGIVMEDGSTHSAVDPNPVERDLIKAVDELDNKVTALLAKRRAKRFDQLSADITKRGK